MIRRQLEIAPTGTHTSTVILLHGCYCEGNDFEPVPQLMRELAGTDSISGVKFIFPSAPLRTLHWPKGVEHDISAWYDYFTCRSNTMHHDEIDQKHLASVTQQICEIIDQETALLGGDSRCIVIGGNSQGGTVAGHVACTYGRPLGALIFMRSCLLDATPVGRFNASKL